MLNLFAICPHKLKQINDQNIYIHIYVRMIVGGKFLNHAQNIYYFCMM